MNFYYFQGRSTGSPLSPPFLYNDSLGSPPPAHIGGVPYSLADPGKIKNLFFVFAPNRLFWFPIKDPFSLYKQRGTRKTILKICQ